jgi:outer membrane protein insertion porin family
MDTPWTVGFDVERTNNRYISDDYEITSNAFITHATYRVNDFVRFGWHYRLKHSHVSVDEKEKEEEPSLESDSKKGGLISGTGVSWTYDSTDHPILPRCGLKSRMEVEFVGLGGDATYFGLAYTNSHFQPMGKKGVIKLRADFRFLLPIWGTTPSDIPIDERLFLGGDLLVRGYRSYRLGPLYKNRKGEKSDDPRGGISMQYYSAEYAYKLHEKFESFVFADAGYLTLHRVNIGKPYVSVGFGARIKVIESIPSLTVGLGFPLNATKSTQVKNFFFSIGGKF